MFSGIIVHHGIVTAIEQHQAGGSRITLRAPEALAQGVAHGDSIAIDGVCLTVIEFDHEHCSFEVIPETLERSTIDHLQLGDRVNLELSLRMGDRLGGHLVYAHVDTTVTLLSRIPEGQGYRVTFELAQRYAPYIVEKGYVALDGVSLTVASVHAGGFTVALIPETAAVTTLGTKPEGALINLEVDPIARYTIDHLVAYQRTLQPTIA